MTVPRVLIIEGLINAVITAAKLTVGMSVGSMAIVGDALHSLSDLANNIVAWLAYRISIRPPDHDHPYGHQKFEPLAVFALATVLAVLAVELAMRAIMDSSDAPVSEPWALWMMLAVLGVNIASAAWEWWWAKRLDSDLLHADVRDTVADVLTTAVIIVGWQFAASGYPWLDRVLTFGIAAFILYMAWGLFRRAVPILVDAAVVEPAPMIAAISEVPQVREVRRVRSRRSGGRASADVVVAVDPGLSTALSHTVADAVERLLAERFDIHDVTVHIEPHER